MEVKPGYKQTEVGVIPTQWDVAPLSKLISSLDAGVSVNSDAMGEVDTQDMTCILKTSCISGGKFIPKEAKLVSFRDLHRVQCPPRKNTIIFSRMNTPALVGECGYVSEDYPNLYLPDRLWITRHNAEISHSVRWLNYTLNFPALSVAIKSSATGTSGSMKNISKPALLSIPVPFPPHAEQKAIASALGDADALIESLERLLAKKRLLKQGAMQSLLTGKTRLPGFSGKWQVKRLGECGSCIRGVSYKGDEDLHPSDSHDTKRLLRSNNVQNSVIVLTDLQFVNQSRVSAQQMMKQNDILVCMANGSKDLVGKSAFFKTADGFHYTFGAFMGVFRTNSECASPAFVFYTFQTSKYRDHIGNLLAGSSINNLRPSQVESMEFKLPPPSEQTAIATVLSDMDEDIAAVEAKLAKARQLKQGMMQELLTGRIRLV